MLELYIYCFLRGYKNGYSKIAKQKRRFRHNTNSSGVYRSFGSFLFAQRILQPDCGRHTNVHNGTYAHIVLCLRSAVYDSDRLSYES